MDSLKVGIDFIINENLTKTIQDLQKTVSQLQTKVSGGGGLKDSFGGLGQVIAGAFAIGAIKNFGGAVVDTLAEFEKYEAVLTNTLGSNSAAKKAMQDITDFAASTPNEVAELTEAYVKLTNQGLQPSMEELRKYGDLAASTGKPIMQLTEAVLDASGSQETERLKEFGIKAKKVGDDISFTFKGQTQVVKANQDAIKNYILSLGNMKGVAGSMDAISKTTGGQLSNLSDNVTSLHLAIGTQLKPVIAFVILYLSKFVDVIKSAVTWLTQHTEVVKTAGVFLAALAIGFGAYNLVMGIFNVVTNGATIAQAALNLVMSLNPIGAVIVAIAALVAGIYYFWTTSEKFRGFLKGLWASVKTIFTNIGTLGKTVFGGLAKMIEGAVTLNWGKVKEGYNDMTKGFKDFGQGVADSFNQGYDLEIQDSYFKRKQEEKDKAKQESPLGSAISTTKKLGTTNTSAGSSLQNQKPQNINIKFNSINEGGIHITTKTQEMSLSMFEDKMNQIFLKYVNQMNTIANAN